MTWEQAVTWLREQPGQEELVKDCFFDDPLLEAARRFHQSEEWRETRKRLPEPPGKALDLGAGRGIGSYALAMDGYDVTALEPDPSALVGATAIRNLAQESDLPITVVQEWGENLPFADDSFDLVHGRQVLHHARSLPGLCKEVARVLKAGGLFIATREHVVGRPEDLSLFLESHPLHALYGGENAFPLPQYINAMTEAGFRFREIIAPFDCAINFFPLSGDELTKELQALWHWPYVPSRAELVENARHCFRFPGRLFSFVGIKPSLCEAQEYEDALCHALVIQWALHDALLAAGEETWIRLDEANRRLKETNLRLEETSLRLEETNRRLDETNRRLNKTVSLRLWRGLKALRNIVSSSHDGA